MGMHLKDCMIYAVDFDGTLCESKFPDIGQPNLELIEKLIEKQKNGDKLILWTNRSGSYLEAALRKCKEWGIIFDAVNENLPEIVKLYSKYHDGDAPSPKITADVYIDDLACGKGLAFGRRTCPVKDCWNSSCPHQKTES